MEQDFENCRKLSALTGLAWLPRRYGETNTKYIASLVDEEMAKAIAERLNDLRDAPYRPGYGFSAFGSQIEISAKKLLAFVVKDGADGASIRHSIEETIRDAEEDGKNRSKRILLNISPF